MLLISAALAAAVAAPTTLNVSEIPVRVVNVCAKSAEIVRQGEFKVAGMDNLLVFRGTVNMKNMQFKFSRAGSAGVSGGADDGAKLIPATVEKVGAGDYRVQLASRENLHIVGELRYTSAKIKVETFTTIWLDAAKNTADVQTNALISQQTGTAWKKVPFSYRSACDNGEVDNHSGSGRVGSTVNVLPVLGYGRATYPVIDAFHLGSLDVGGTGEPATVVLDRHTVNIVWQQRVDSSAGSVPFRYVTLPIDKKYGQRIIIHDGNKRTFEVYGKIRAGKLELPLGRAE